jgi:hypothetical protein
MGHNNIVGSLPDGIAELTSLTFLALWQNGFVGTIPDEIAQLQSLTYLGLWSNKFTGVVPDLPFAQYTNGCYLHSSKNPSNAFVCPLPADSALCGEHGSPPTCSCTGSSSNLTQPECEWWINFFDTMGGAKWTSCGSDRTDPCACSYTHPDKKTYGVTCYGPHIVKL